MMVNAFDEVAEGEPSTIRAGDLVSWRRSDLGAAYPPSDYTLLYDALLENSTTARLDIAATADGDDFLVSVPSATSTSWGPGVYQWVAIMVRNSDSERVTVDRGKFIVKANFAASTDDPRSHARKMLDAIESLLENKAVSDVASYEINGRKLTKLSPQELMTWRTTYRGEVARENRRARGKAGREVRKVRFN